MNKSLFGKFFVFLLVVGLLFAAAPTTQVEAQTATLDVCPSGCAYNSIQAAINAAADGDTISVGPGTYNEPLLINKPLTVKSTDGAATTIISKDVIYVVIIRSSNVTFDGFTVMSPGFNGAGADLGGIMIGYYGDNSLTNIKVKNNIVTQIGDPNRIVTTSDWPSVGICVNGVIDGLEITGNTIHDLTQVVNDDTVTYGPTGIAFYGYDTTPLSTNVVISGNTIYNIGFTGTGTGAIANGIRAGWGSGTGQISGNTIYGVKGRGIAVTSANNGAPVITGNTISSSNEGVFMANAGGGSVTNNTFHGNVTNINVTGAAVGNVTTSGNITTVAAGESIQAAINAASIGETIRVGAGTYTENLIINKALTLQSTNCEGKIVGTIGIRASNVTLQGLDISNPGPVNGINLSNDQLGSPYLTLSNISILNNKIHDIGGVDGGNTKAIKAAHGPDNITIEGNQFYNIKGVGYGHSDAISIGDTAATDPSTGVVIRNNTFVNITSVAKAGNAISFNNKTGVTALIEGNTFAMDTIIGAPTFYSTGIGLGGPTPGTVIQNNTFNVTNPANVSTSTVGINFEANTSAASVVIEKNGFLGGGYPLINAASYTVDASPNWFGQATGPAVNQPVNGAGLVYIPWCTNAGCTEFGAPPVHNVTQNTYFYTIQAAVDAAVANDAITVAAGSYEGFSVVGKTGLTITGAGDAATIIAPTTLITTGVGHKYTPNMLASVFVNGSTGITIEGMAIKSTAATPGSGGADAIVFWNNSTGSIKESIVQGIYTINGAQTGQGIAVDGGTSLLSLINTDISGFQKNGIDVVDGNGGTTPGNLTVNVSGGVITGAGPTATIAQNGIVLFNRAGGVLGGSVTGATISGFDYTPTTAGATGILAYGLGGGTLTVSGNTFGVSEVSMTDITGTLNLYTILANNTFPPYSAVIGDSIKLSPTKMMIDPATVGTTDTCTGTHEITVKVQDVTDLVAYYLNMTYDKDLITVTNVQNLTLVGAAAPGNTWANGVIKFGWYQPSGGGNPATYNGNVALIKITFQSKGLAGTSAFTILPSSALEEWPNAFGIPFEITGGTNVSFGSIVTNTTMSPNKSYCDLALAVSQAASGDTLRADANITSNVSITVDKALTLNTNGKTISRTVALTNNNSFVVIPGGDLTIDGGGTITTSSGNAILITGGASSIAKVKLVNATLYGPNLSVGVVGNFDPATHATPYPAVFEMVGGATNETVLARGNGAELIISGGTMTGAAPIMGNGTKTTAVNNGGTKITISGTAVIGSETLGWVAVYHPQEGELNINGGTIKGYNGVEMKAGTLNLTGGTISAYGAYVASPEKTGNGTTNTGDAILIYSRDGYGTGTMNVNISGTPTITSAYGYALREFTHSDETSRLGVAAISGGHFTGGTVGAVSFTTNTDANLDLTGGDYSTDPIVFVYAPYGTSLHADGRWYISGLPVLTSDDFDDPVTLGVASSFTLTVDPSVPGTFNMVFTGYPSETELTYDGVTYYCVGTPCVITVSVTLTGTAPETLPFSVVVATGGAEIPAASYAVTATLHAPAPAYGTTGRDLASLSATVNVVSGFTVSGTVTMQGRTVRGGVPVYLTWNNTLGVIYGPSMNTDEQAVNFRLAVNYGGTYTITTLQPRFLNITSDLAKTINVTGNYTFANPLWLRAGNAIWRNPSTGAYDNTIGVTDAQKVLDSWETTGGTDSYDNSGDVNFDNIVSIKDLALVGGNMDLTSAIAYGTGANIWLP